MTPGSKARKKPRCSDCGSPMEGHKRPQGRPVCPILLPSPPTSPTSAPQSQRACAPTPQPSQKVDPPSFVIPPSGHWHRKNPNYVDPPPARPPSIVGSVVPTVLVDEDGNTVINSDQASDNEEEEEDSKSTVTNTSHSTDSLFEYIVGMSNPVVSIFDTRKEDIPRIRDTAATLGVHVGVLHSPPKNPSVSVPLPGRENSWWVVMGQSADHVRRIVDSQQRGMPGSIANGATEMETMMEGPRVVTFLQLALAGFIGGLVVVCGLSLL